MRDHNARAALHQFVQRVLNEPLHMEAIEDHARLGHVLLDRLDERTRHVDGDRLELRGPFGPQSLEERGQRLGALALAGPHDRAALVVDDDEISGDTFASVGSLSDFVAGKLAG